MNGYLLDTNTISELMRIQPAQGVLDWLATAEESRLFLSVLTLGEIQLGIEGMAHGKRRNALEQWLDRGLRVRFASRLLGIDEPTALLWGTVAARAKRNGRTLPVADGLLAATALAHRLIIVTRNADDFRAAQVEVLNPWRNA